MKIAVVLAIIFIKGAIDTAMWGNVNHGVGLALVALILIPMSLYERNPWPIFLYACIWNPFISILNGLPFFYLGKTARFDILLTEIFGASGGRVWFYTMLIFFIISYFKLYKHVQ